MFFSILTTLVLGSLIGVVTSVSVYGFISLVKFLTAFFRNPDRTFENFQDFLTNTSRICNFSFFSTFPCRFNCGLYKKICI